MSSLFASLHHLAALMLVASLSIELVLLRLTFNLQTARTLLRVDMIYGASAGLVLVVGLLRVFHFEKGAAYYVHSLPFDIKFALFVLVGLMSIYPTLEIMSWRKALGQGLLPEVTAEKLRAMRMIVHTELLGVALIVICAAMAARGIGYWG